MNSIKSKWARKQELNLQPSKHNQLYNVENRYIFKGTPDMEKLLSK